MGVRMSAVVARLETASDRTALLELHRTIVELDNTHAVLQNKIAVDIRNVQEMFERSNDMLQSAYATLGRNIATLVDIPNSVTAVTTATAPSSLAEHLPDTQIDEVPPPPPPPPPPRTANS